MCVSVHKYQSTIHKLETEVYPALHNTLQVFDVTIPGTFCTVTHEIIPAIQKGDVAKAKEVATGVQKERFKKILDLLQ